MSDDDTYDARVRAIRAYNQPILEDFRAWLEQSGISEKTVKDQVNKIHFFTEYLVYYEPLKKLDQANSSDIRMFFMSWFPYKALWTSETGIKSYLASFKKFFLWMGETGHVSAATVSNVLTTLKEGRDQFLERAADYNSYPRFIQ